LTADQSTFNQQKKKQRVGRKNAPATLVVQGVVDDAATEVEDHSSARKKKN